MTEIGTHRRGTFQCRFCWFSATDASRDSNLFDGGMVDGPALPSETVIADHFAIAHQTFAAISFTMDGKVFGFQKQSGIKS